ncbi:MAG: DUF2183 domain-containing protein [Deltaproteobacteria bacterium]|nr:DUF2183 domain-containing protein [Deltaproteobacteria bacterium]
MVLLLGVLGCGAPSEEEALEELGVLGGKADTVLREVSVRLSAGKTRRYRVRAKGLSARLTQTDDVVAKLEAYAGAFRCGSDESSAPAVRCQGDDSERSWTLKLSNLDERLLVGKLTVSALAAPNGAAEFGIVSDIDDTILPPHGRNAALPASYPGVAALYTELELGGGGRPGDMYYVTARSPERVVEIPPWLAANGLPAGAIETGISTMPWIVEKEKIKDVTKIFEAQPGQRFVLFGDSSARDAEVYQAIRAAYPTRVAAAFIHRVKTIDASRVSGLHLVENYAVAAARLFGLSILDEAAARRIMRAAQRDGLAISDREIDGLLAANRP